ncbi:Glutaredoxin 3 [Paraconexibacter sp. AEG42_29]|uniref:Glutaredoxin 3 n=1 Tax=Paraconexibacter sp. AEG42_29 TaxID=2997339 RepID=A0AAU7AXI6_9ACTN
MAEVIVYTTEPCPYCTRVKSLLAKRGVEYSEINLARDADGRSELVEKTGMMSFPQVIIDGTLVGGFDQTLAADKSGKLAELLAA